MNKLFSILTLNLLLCGSLFAQAKSGLDATFELVNEQNSPVSTLNHTIIDGAEYRVKPYGIGLTIEKYVNNKKVLKKKFPNNAGEYKRTDSRQRECKVLGNYFIELFHYPKGKKDNYFISAINTNLELKKSLLMATAPHSYNGGEIKYYEIEGHILFVQQDNSSANKKQITLTALNENLEKIEFDKYIVDADENTSILVKDIKVSNNFLSAIHQVTNKTTGETISCSYKRYSLDGNIVAEIELDLPKQTSTVHSAVRDDKLYITGFTHDNIVKGIAGTAFHAIYALESEKLINYDEEALEKEYIEDLYSEHELNQAKEGKEYNKLNYNITETHLLENGGTISVAEHFIKYKNPYTGNSSYHHYVRNGIDLIKTNKKGEIVWTKHLNRHIHTTENAKGLIFQRYKNGQLHLVYHFDYNIIVSLIDVKYEEVETSIVYNKEETNRILIDFDNILELEENKFAIYFGRYKNVNALKIEFVN